MKLTSQKVFTKSFRESQFPHKFVNLFCLLVMIKEDKLKDLRRNCLLQNDVINTFWGITRVPG